MTKKAKAALTSEEAQSPFTSIQHAKKRAFLAAYSQTGNAVRAAEAAGCDRVSHWLWMKNDPEYADLFETAKELACVALEVEAVRRATEGVDEPVFHQGKKCGAVRKYSDTLLIFLMKGAMPAKYRENQKLELSGINGEPIQSKTTVELVYVNDPSGTPIPPRSTD